MTIPVCAIEYAADDIIGYLTLFAVNNSADADLGHAFLQFENTSSITLTIGPYGVSPGEGITISVWRDVDGHNGIAYNIESFLHYDKGRFTNRASITIPLRSSDRTTLNNLLYSNRNWEYNAITDNCVDFSLLLWYSVCSDYTFSTGKTSTTAASPRLLFASMQQFSDCVSGDTITYNYNVKALLNTYTLGYISTTNLRNNSSLGAEEESDVMNTPSDNVTDLE